MVRMQAHCRHNVSIEGVEQKKRVRYIHLGVSNDVPVTPSVRMFDLLSYRTPQSCMTIIQISVIVLPSKTTMGHLAASGTPLGRLWASTKRLWVFAGSHFEIFWVLLGASLGSRGSHGAPLRSRSQENSKS